MSAADIRRGNDYLAPRPTPATVIKVRRWRPFRNAARTILGYLSAELPSGVIINDCKLMIGPNGKPWIALPAVKQLATASRSSTQTAGRRIRRSSSSAIG
jgi:hypothetical protein